MKKSTWYVMQFTYENGKSEAIAQRVPHMINLAAKLIGLLPYIVEMNACDSKTDALKLAEKWNEYFKKRGVYGGRFDPA